MLRMKRGGLVTQRLIDQLRADLDGAVLTPSHPEYDAARTLFVGGIDRRPAAVVRPPDSAAVARVIARTRDFGVPLAIRGGGHSGAGHSVCDDGIVLDMSVMKSLVIGDDGHTAWAEAGLTAAEYNTAVGERGLATGFGDTGSVGIAGITLGGGVGFLSRRHGLTIDQLLAAEVVSADGEVLQVDDDAHADLFWAIRGGGGNFGVATRFRFRLHEVPVVTGGVLILPASAAVLASFLAEAEAAPEELTTIVNVMPAPPMPFIPEEAQGRMVVIALMCHVGPAVDGERVLAPFRALADPIVDMVGPTTYPALFLPTDPDNHPTAVAHTMFVDSIDETLAGEVIERLERSDAPVRAAQFRVLGGRISTIAPGATAYAHRQSRMMVNLAAFYETPEEKARRTDWVTEFSGAIHQGDTGAYVNFLGEEGPDRVRAAYPGATWDRLVAVKRRYDPTNLFRLNQNISPD
jgi:FAD/FMN-containing dehydrogenase